jgi:hypothetical protein
MSYTRLKSDTADQTPSRARNPLRTQQRASGQGKRADDVGSQVEARPADPSSVAGSKRSDDEGRTGDLYHKGHE